MAENNKAMSLDNTKRYIKGILQGWIGNKSTLDKLSEGQSGELLYNGNSIGGSGGSGSIAVDDALSSTSENPVQNKVIYEALQNAGTVPLTVDDALNDTSENPVQNKVIKAVLDSKADLSDIPDVSGFALTSDLDGKQNILTFDSAPTEDSSNPVTSGGIFQAIQNAGSNFQLPIASQLILGGIKVGAGLEVSQDGTISVVGFQKLNGYIVLSKNSVSLNQTTESDVITILNASGEVSVESSNPSLVSVALSDNQITLSKAGGENDGGEATITVSVAETINYTGASTSISVEIIGAVSVASWADATPQQIKDMLDAHYSGVIDIHDYWNVGDERTVHLSAMAATGVGESHAEQDVTLVLVNSGGKMLSNGTTECAFVVAQKDVLATDGYMNAANPGGLAWKDTARRTWCNNVYRNAIPSDLKDCFKEHINKSSVGANSSIVQETTDYFSLPAQVELMGSGIGNEGTRFQYYTSNSIAKSRPYWTRTSGTNSNNYAYFIYINNTTSSRYSVAATRGLAPFGVI